MYLNFRNDLASVHEEAGEEIRKHVAFHGYPEDGIFYEFAV